MAKRSKDPNQGALFAFSKPSKRVATKSEVKFTPMKNELVVMAVGYKNGRDTYHQSMPESYVDDHKKFRSTGGYDSINIMSLVDYWVKFKEGGFVAGS